MTTENKSYNCSQIDLKMPKLQNKNYTPTKQREALNAICTSRRMTYDESNQSFKIVRSNEKTGEVTSFMIHKCKSKLREEHKQILSPKNQGVSRFNNNQRFETSPTSHKSRHPRNSFASYSGRNQQLHNLNLEKLNKVEQVVKCIEITQALIIILSVTLAYIANQIYESVPNSSLGGNTYNGDLDDFDVKNREWKANALRWFNLIISLSLFILELMNYSKKSTIKVLYHDLEKSDPQDYLPKNSVFMPNFTVFIIKFILFLIVSPPGYNIVIEGDMLGGKFSYTLDGIIMVITLHRLFFLVNLYFFLSKWAGKTFKNMLKNYNIHLVIYTTESA